MRRSEPSVRTATSRGSRARVHGSARSPAAGRAARAGRPSGPEPTAARAAGWRRDALVVRTVRGRRPLLAAARRRRSRRPLERPDLRGAGGAGTAPRGAAALPLGARGPPRRVPVDHRAGSGVERPGSGSRSGRRGTGRIPAPGSLAAVPLRGPPLARRRPTRPGRGGGQSGAGRLGRRASAPGCWTSSGRYPSRPGAATRCGAARCGTPTRSSPGCSRAAGTTPRRSHRPPAVARPDGRPVSSPPPGTASGLPRPGSGRTSRPLPVGPASAAIVRI